MVKEVRRHWFVMVAPVFGAVILALFPLVAIIILSVISFSVFDHISLGGPASALVIALYSWWLLFVTIFLIIRWTEYYLDVWYITNMRVVDVDQSSLFSRKTKTLSLRRIQDITVDVKGFIATTFDFGDVHVQTAGSSRQIILRQSQKPYEVKRMILRCIEEAPRRKGKPFKSEGSLNENESKDIKET